MKALAISTRASDTIRTERAPAAAAGAGAALPSSCASTFSIRLSR